MRLTELPLAPSLSNALGVRAIGDGIARRGRRADVRGPRRVERIWRDVTGLVRPAPLFLAAAAAAPTAGVAVRRHGGPVHYLDGRRGDDERGRVDASPGHTRQTGESGPPNYQSFAFQSFYNSFVDANTNKIKALDA